MSLVLVFVEVEVSQFFLYFVQIQVLCVLVLLLGVDLRPLFFGQVVEVAEMELDVLCYSFLLKHVSFLNVLDDDNLRLCIETKVAKFSLLCLGGGSRQTKRSSSLFFVLSELLDEFSLSLVVDQHQLHFGW